MITNNKHQTLEASPNPSTWQHKSGFVSKIQGSNVRSVFESGNEGGVVKFVS